MRDFWLNRPGTLLTTCLLVLPSVSSIAGYAAEHHASLPTVAQQKEDLKHVTGTVTDENGEPLIGAAVNVPGSPYGTIVDADGRYEFYVPKECKEVQVSYVGMKTAIIPLRSHENDNHFVLTEDKSMLNEVVVTGYQTLSKERTTGAFAKVTSTDLQDKRFSDLSSLLQGEIAGYNTQNNQIRGISTMNGVATPLYVVDGFPIENTNYSSTGSITESIPSLNIDDIESVTVLKDASAASIYGARAANGVIVITTKNARKNKKVDVNFSMNLVWNPYSYDYDRLTNSSDIVNLEKLWASDNPNLKGDGASAYYVRNLVNQYATDNGNGVATYNIPYGNIYYRANQNRQSYIFRHQLNFDKTFGGKHNVVALAGHEVRRSIIDYDNSTLYNYDDDMLSYALIDQTALSSIAGLMRGYGLQERDFAYMRNLDNRYISFYANAAYTYDDKYVASASVRWDRSNLWGTNSEYQNKPIWSMGLAWNIDKEDWFHVSWVDRLKLRFSHGIAGNIAKDAAPYMTAGYYNNNNVGGQYGSINSRPNPDLRWEKTTTTDIGIDFDLLKGRLYGSIEYYNKKGSDLLANTMGVPTEGWGYSTYKINNGEMRNRGFEMTLGGDIVRTKDFRLDGSLTYSYNQNKVTYVNVTAPVYYLQLDYPEAYPVIGNSYNGLYGYHFAGLSEEGLPQIYDAEGKAVTYSPGDLESIHYLGSNTPTSLASIKLGAHYKGFSLSVLATYMGGYKARNTDLPMFSNNYNSATGSYIASIAPVNSNIMNAWTPQNTNTDVPRVVYGESPLFNYDSRSIYYYSDANVYDMSHWELSNISLSYTLPRQWVHLAHLSNVRLQLDVENVATIAKSKTAHYMLAGNQAPNYVFGLYLDL